MLLITGSLVIASVSRLSISPATTKLWPSPSSTLVSARRVASAGNQEAAERHAVGEIDASKLPGFRCSLMVLFAVITGVNRRRMPNSLNWTVTAPAFPPPCRTGTGNSPPTRKLASLPLVVTRFGSARICRMFSALQRLDERAQSSGLGRKAKMLRASRDRSVWLELPARAGSDRRRV